MSLRIKSITLGDGIPRICVPITGKSREEILSQSEIIARSQPDLVEWRSDYYEDVLKGESALQILESLSGIFWGIPVIFTFRSVEEGGNKEISVWEYQKLNIAVAQQAKADLIDVEVYRKDFNACSMIRQIHHLNGKVVGSNHNFQITYESEKMAEILYGMDECGADILKLAMMPKTPEDILRLFEVTRQVSDNTQKPVVTISMGNLGKISRIGGGVFGSAITFASAVDVSAPGQIPLSEMRHILAAIYNSIAKQ